MRNTKQAFTLVELIVVITILAILGTIAFISLQGYSAEARNSKRTSDLNSLASKINIQVTEGTSLLSFVTSVTATRLTWTQSVSWTWIIAWTDYEAGTPNYLVLWIKSDVFKDPAWDEYKVGLTTKKSGEYELAASVENGSGERETKIIGTYNNRAGAAVTFDTAPSATTVKLLAADYNKFVKGDIVTGSWITAATVFKVSSDLSTLTITGGDFSSGWGTTIQLAGDLSGAESAWLIADKTDTTSPITNGSTTLLPY